MNVPRESDAHLWEALNDPATHQGAREELIVLYMPLVRYVARRYGTRLPDTVEHEDLVSYGVFGLIDAVSRFDPARGVKFSSYAAQRIQGAIIDELRALDWAPRSLRSKARNLHRAGEVLFARLHRAPTDAELAGELGWTPEQVFAVRTNDVVSHLLPLDMPGAGDQADVALEDPDLAVVVATTREHFARGVTALPKAERAVAAMHWRGGLCPSCRGEGRVGCARCRGVGRVSGLTLGEIAALLGISESWCCALYTQAATALRQR